MFLNKKFLIIAVAVAVAAVLLVTGFPELDISESIIPTTNTDNIDRGSFKGVGELLGPLSRKGYIVSYKQDGLSETIVAQGTAKITDEWLGRSGMTKFRYKVYGKTDAGASWEAISVPGQTSKYVSNPNPGEKTISGTQLGGTKTFESYSFNIVSDHYEAIKVIFQGYINWDVLNPFEGYKWMNLQVDYAYLYPGWGGLYLPERNGVPVSTFEIGETVNIGVLTTYGGQTVGEGKTWRVALIEPADRGGEEIKHQDYGDNVDSYFSFEITEDMFSTSSTNEYKVKIYNTLIPKGSLLVHSIDVLAKAPGDVKIESDNIQVKIGSNIDVVLSAEINEETQLPIDYFRVSVIYGANDVLLPGDYWSDRWIVHTTSFDASKVSGSKYQTTVSFTPDKESYVTVHAKAVDTEGRASEHTKVFTIWCYKDNAAPDDVIDDETGEDIYDGGHTSDWWSVWDASSGNWPESFQISLIGVAVSLIVFTVIAIIAMLWVPGGMNIKLLVVLLGAVISVLLYIFVFSGL